MKLLSHHYPENKRVLLRTDYNVPVEHGKITDFTRIKETIPTIKELLKRNNKVIILSHRGRPKGIDGSLSLELIIPALSQRLPGYKILLVSDFEKETTLLKNQSTQEILLLENMRFHKGEEDNDKGFAKKLAALGEVYINDAFSVSHRKAASVVGITKYLPSYAGFSLQKEVDHLSSFLTHPPRPFIAIIGGGKISTKLTLLNMLHKKVDQILLGGGMATTCLQAKGLAIGQSISEPSVLSEAKDLLKTCGDSLLLPVDVIVETVDHEYITRIIDDIQPHETIRDIGPQTISRFSKHIEQARTILWNGPVGFFETPPFNVGTDSLYRAIIKNPHAKSIVGGGDTVSALSHFSDFQSKITHVSLGGGAMLEFLENGSLPGIDALK